jgi:phosphate transport system protein
MPVHFHRDLEKLKKEILTLGSMVEEATTKAIVALVDRRPELAEEVINGDNVIDRKELEVEEECLKIMALHQPVAADLRFLVVVLKVNNELERIGDLAVNIAERAAYITSREPIRMPEEFSSMVEVARSMLCDSLDALVNKDAELARQVIERDNLVDEMHRKMWMAMQELMVQEPAVAKRASSTQAAAYQLERIADHATNIAEDVVYMVRGAVVRHESLHKNNTDVNH